MRRLLLAAILLSTGLNASRAFSRQHRSTHSSRPPMPTMGVEEERRTTNVIDRKSFLSGALLSVGLFGIVGDPSSVAGAAVAEGTIYKSGKTPIVPGQKPKDKGDVKGTRKDPDFLRSISDCKNQCQSTMDGLAKSKEDCLSECQDICCKTYEQCTFDIVPRL